MDQARESEDLPTLDLRFFCEGRRPRSETSEKIPDCQSPRASFAIPLGTGRRVIATRFDGQGEP